MEVIDENDDCLKPSGRFSFKFFNIFNSARGKPGKIDRAKSCERDHKKNEFQSVVRQNRSLSASPTSKRSEKNSLFRIPTGCCKGTTVGPMEIPPPSQGAYEYEKAIATKRNRDRKIPKFNSPDTS